MNKRLVTGHANPDEYEHSQLSDRLRHKTRSLTVTVKNWCAVPMRIVTGGIDEEKLMRIACPA
ncbi:unnamed protein product [Haemonchus placei]|uniref:Mobile element protein n=1 Tax=Haemonchus placei TaxID=6290 RepID=A0A0N4W2W2_HAEPC|nr:unnamed protein product [Haemonchus placei]